MPLLPHDDLRHSYKLPSGALLPESIEKLELSAVCRGDLKEAGFITISELEKALEKPDTFKATMLDVKGQCGERYVQNVRNAIAEYKNRSQTSQPTPTTINVEAGGNVSVATGNVEAGGNVSVATGAKATQNIHGETSPKKRRWWVAIVVAVIATAGTVAAPVISAWMGSEGNDQSTLDIPKKFNLTMYDSWTDPEFPEYIVGTLDDRQWMRLAEDGAQSQLSIAFKDFRAVWILTEEIVKTERFTAYLYPGTRKLIYVQAYEGSPKRFHAVTRLGDGPGDEYRFEIPKRNNSSRLLVLVALREDIYESIKSDPKFTLMSQPQ